MKELALSDRNLLLVVDDERDFLELVDEIAKGVGYEVLAADNTPAFRELVSQHRPSIIFLDLQMPGMDGVEALRHLALIGAQAGILLVSGMDQRVLASAHQLGGSLGLKMLGTLQKPAMLDDIETVLRNNMQHQETISAVSLQRAIEEYELVVYYQPILQRNENEWRVGALEALVRWQHPLRGLLLPAEFLPLAEGNDLITGVTDFVLNDAIRQVGHWRSRGLEVGVAVNLSARLVRDLEFPDRLAQVLREYSVAAESLTFEVKETPSAMEWDLVMDSFARLRVRGVGLALDDFGVGMSSLTHLYKMPFNNVKIDNMLINEMATSTAAATIVKAIIELAHSLSLTVTAEGVQTSTAFDLLDQAGCDNLQGQFISKPLPAAEVERFILAWSGAAAL